MESSIIIEVTRDGYSTNQINNPITVAELRAFLEDYDDDTPIFLSHDSGYTFGTIRERDIRLEENAE